jgi:hypothetical protein
MLAHRLIMGCTFDDGISVDHRDRDGLNCVRSNLRRCSHKENMRYRVRQNNNTSGYKGVFVVQTKKGTKYQAYINKDGKRHHLGWWWTKEEAAKEYNKAAVRLFGEFAMLNQVI